jgi:protein-S-isoprenylcysteine O-methyltransferase Ste14
MALREELRLQGTWLFRWRSYAPLSALPLVIVAAVQFTYPCRSRLAQQCWEILCFSVALIGLAIRVLTVGYAPHGTSGRNTRQQKADVLNTAGVYSVVRHPLYLGNFFIGLGLSLFYLQWWLTLSFVLLFWLYYERIMFTEEEFLREKFSSSYLEWANQTPAFVPAFRKWRPSAREFSPGFALRAEGQCFALIVCLFGLMDLGEELVAEGRWALDPHWKILCPLTLGLFAALWLCKKAKLV